MLALLCFVCRGTEWIGNGTERNGILGEGEFLGRGTGFGGMGIFGRRGDLGGGRKLGGLSRILGEGDKLGK